MDRFLGLFFYDTPFKNGIFGMVALIARRSKYDFWIPGEILTLEKKSRSKIIFLSRSKILIEKKIRNFFRTKIFSSSKNRKNHDFRFFRFLDAENFFGPKKKSGIFFSIKIFDLEKK